MTKNRWFSSSLKWFLMIFAFLAFAVVLCQSLQRPVSNRMAPNIHLVQLLPVGPVEDGAYTVYRETLPERAWSDPICAVTANRTSFSVELNGSPLYTHTPGAYEHGGIVHWVHLPHEDLSGKILTVSSPSNDLTVFAGDYNELLLYYHNANVSALVFAFLFLLLGVGILLLSLGARVLMGRQRPWTLRYLGILVVLMGMWVASDTTVAQMLTGRGAVMSVIAQYAFMAMPFFFLQFYRSLLACDSRVLQFLSLLHLLDLCISGLLQALGVVQLYQLLFITHLLMICTLGAVLRLLLSQRHTEYSREVHIMLGGFACLVLLGGMALVDYYFVDGTQYVLWFSSGMLLFVIFLLVVAVCYVYREMVKSSRLQYYQKLANTDLMTRLQSRTAFEERSAQSAALEGFGCCIVMDINDLKKANDTMGHLAGDELICDAAECVLSVFESLGDCYRMGGDEFVVLLENTTPAAVQSALAGLELCVSRKNLTRPFPLSMAVGHATATNGAVAAMLHEADRNMYENKAQIKSRPAV